MVTANIWAGMAKTLVNTILAVVSTSELELAPFANVECFVHLKSVEVSNLLFRICLWILTVMTRRNL